MGYEQKQLLDGRWKHLVAPARRTILTEALSATVGRTPGG